MTELSFLADEIRKSAWTSVKIKSGRTNGRPVLHVRDLTARRSDTIYDRAGWLLLPCHPDNRPARIRDEAG